MIAVNTLFVADCEIKITLRGKALKAEHDTRAVMRRREIDKLRAASTPRDGVLTDEHRAYFDRLEDMEQ
jgi:hypothetical protein